MKVINVARINLAFRTSNSCISTFVVLVDIETKSIGVYDKSPLNKHCHKLLAISIQYAFVNIQCDNHYEWTYPFPHSLI